jgi:hypothetical protein
MSEEWTCSRCSTVNVAERFGCSNCGLLRHDIATVGSSLQAASPGSSLEEPTEPGPVEAAVPTAPPSLPADSPTSPGTGASWVTPEGDYGAAPPAAKPLWRRIPIGWLIFAVLIGGGAITGWYFNASRSTTGEITKAGDMTAADLRVGDCFVLKDPAADEVDDVTAGPCTSPHEFEMFFVGSMAKGDYPTQTAFETYLTDNCYPAFDAYIGKSHTESELSIYWLTPTEEGWGAGDHSVQCAAYHPRVHVQTKSLKGSEQ